MKNPRNERVITLLKTLGIDVMEASARIKKQPTTLYRIVNNENEASKATLKILAEELNANYDWLLTGKGEMFSEVTNEAPAQESAISKALDLLEQQLKKKDDQISSLLALLGKVNFHKLLPETDSTPVITLNTNQAGPTKAAA